MLVLRLLLLPLAALLVAAAAPVLTLPVDAPFVDAQVAGRAVRLRVSFDAPGPLTLTPAAVQRLGLRPQLPATILVGPERLHGGSAVVTLALEGGRTRLQAIWTDRPPTADGPEIAGLVNPGALPLAGVRLIRAGAPAGRRRSLPAQVAAVTGLGFRVTVAGTAILVRLAPEQPDTVATAAAGALLARARNGATQGAIGRRTIAYGIERPVRLLTLARPVRPAGLAVRRLVVRSADYGDAARTSAIDPAESAEEIIVTGPGHRGPTLYRVTLGADVIGRCAEIGWEAARQRLVLDCPDIDGSETIR